MFDCLKIMENVYYFPKMSTKKILKKFIKIRYKNLIKLKETAKIKLKHYSLFLKKAKKIKTLMIYKITENKKIIKLNIRFLTKTGEDLEITVSDLTFNEFLTLNVSKTPPRSYRKTLFKYSPVVDYDFVLHNFKIFLEKSKLKKRSKKLLYKNLAQIEHIANNIPHSDNRLLKYTQSNPRQAIYQLNAFIGEHFLLSFEGKTLRNIINKLIAADLNETYHQDIQWSFKDETHETYHIGPGLPNYDFEIKLNDNTSTSLEFKNLYSLDYGRSLSENTRKNHGARYVLCYLYNKGTVMQLFRVVKGIFVDLIATIDCQNLKEQRYLKPEIFPDSWEDMYK
jgi:hypothetical protein